MKKLLCIILGHRTGEYTQQGLEVLPVGKVWDMDSKLYNYLEMRHKAGVSTRMFKCLRCGQRCDEKLIS